MASMLAPDEMFTIEPLPCSSMCSAARRERRQTLPRFRANTWSHSLSRPLGDRSRRGTAGAVDQDVESTELAGEFGQ